MKMKSNSIKVLLVPGQKIIMVMRGADQKFFAEALKNSAAENLPDNPLRLLNNPPERKAFIRNPTSIAINRPLEKEEMILLKFASRSANTSTLIPFFSISVIMLLPNPDFNAPFIGIATRLTSKREHNHIIRTPLRDFVECDKPAFKGIHVKM